LKVSVVIPVYRGEQFVAGLLAAIVGQTVTCSEIWVVETEATEEVRLLAAGFGARYVSVAATEFDHAGTRTEIAQRTSGDYLIFLTQDVLPRDEHAFARLLAPFAEDDLVAATYGRQVPDSGAHPFSVIKRNFNYPEVSITKTLADANRLGLRTVSLSNAFAAYRRTALAEVGWFGNRQLMCEDISAAARILVAGYSIRYTADAVVQHTHDLEWKAELRRYFDIGVAHKQQDWIREQFGRPTREGLRYLDLGVRQLVANGHVARLPEFIVRCLLGNLAYSLGRVHRLLPPAIRTRSSSFPLWWHGSTRTDDPGEDSRVGDE